MGKKYPSDWRTETLHTGVSCWLGLWFAGVRYTDFEVPPGSWAAGLFLTGSWGSEVGVWAAEPIFNLEVLLGPVLFSGPWGSQPARHLQRWFSWLSQPPLRFPLFLCAFPPTRKLGTGRRIQNEDSSFFSHSSIMKTCNWPSRLQRWVQSLGSSQCGGKNSRCDPRCNVS